MIKCFLIITLIVVNNIAFAQIEINGNENKDKKIDYTLKSESQKNTGLVLLFVGVALIAGGAALDDSGSSNVNNFGYNDNFDTQLIFIGSGFVSIGASIPFFILARKNKIKSRKLEIGLKSERFESPTVYHQQLICPAISFKVRL